MTDEGVRWFKFCSLAGDSASAGDDGWYSQLSPSVTADYAAFKKDLEKGVPAAVEKAKRFAIWRLKNGC